MREQGPSNTAFPPRRLDEQILEVQTRPGEKCGEVPEVQREAGRFIAHVRDDGVRDSLRTEEMPLQVVFGGDDGVSELFVAGEVFDELQNQRDITNRGPLDAEVGRHGGMLRQFPVPVVLITWIRSRRSWRRRRRLGRRRSPRTAPSIPVTILITIRSRTRLAWTPQRNRPVE